MHLPAALKPLGVQTPPVRIFSQSPSGVRSGAAGITKEELSIEIAGAAMLLLCTKKKEDDKEEVSVEIAGITTLLPYTRTNTHTHTRTRTHTHTHGSQLCWIQA